MSITVTGVDSRKARTAMRNKAIRDQFNLLYEVDGLRYDWAVERLAQNFFLSERTVKDILTLPTH